MCGSNASRFINKLSKSDEIQNGYDDNHGANQPNDAVHDLLLLMS
jgi:hypothetical protein